MRRLSVHAATLIVCKVINLHCSCDAQNAIGEISQPGIPMHLVMAKKPTYNILLMDKC